MMLPTSAQKFLLEGKDTLSLVCLDSFFDYLQEHPLLLQGFWHILAESSIFCLYFRSCHEAFQKSAVNPTGFVTTMVLLLPGQSQNQKHSTSFLYAYLKD